MAAHSTLAAIELTERLARRATANATSRAYPPISALDGEPAHGRERELAALQRAGLPRFLGNDACGHDRNRRAQSLKAGAGAPMKYVAHLAHEFTEAGGAFRRHAMTR